MEDHEILDLYFARSEAAITQTDAKYGGYCYSIAYNILTNNEDAEESVSDTYYAAWKAIPPKRPAMLSTFLGKITRHISINRWHSRSAYKRGGGEMTLALEELEACVADRMDVEKDYAQKETIRAFRRFLDMLPETERNVFLRRYWCVDTIEDIANSFGFSQSKVKSMLLRTRKKLRAALQKEGLL